MESVWILVASLALYYSLPIVVCESTVRFVHFNDIHSRVEPASKFQGVCGPKDKAGGSCYGGFAKIAKVVKDKRGQGENNLVVLDAGDEFMGTIWNSVYKGSAAAEILNRIGVDAMALGNHEFDYGPSVLGRFLEELNVPVVCSNIDVDTEPSLRGKLTSSVTLDVNGVKVGVVGYTTPEIKSISNPGRRIGFQDVLSNVQDTIDALKAEGVKIVVGLGHIGYERDVELASNLTSVDIIIGGHTHTKPKEYPKIVKSRDGFDVAVVQAFWASRYVGYMEATFNDDGNLVAVDGELIELGDDPNKPSSYVPDDEEIKGVVDTLKGPVAEFATKVIGSSEVFLNGDRTDIRRSETNLGSLVCDTMVWYTQERTHLVEKYGSINVCLINGGAVRNSIDEGEITVEEVVSAQPFGNVMAVLSLTAAELYKGIELGLRRFGELEGEFPQLSGIKLQFCGSLPVGQRVTSLEIFDGLKYMPISRDDSLTRFNFITSSFLANGGDGYTVFADAEPVFLLGSPVDIAFQEYVGEFSPIVAKTDGRIREVCTRN